MSSFYELQRQARQGSAKLIALFALSIVLTCAAVWYAIGAILTNSFSPQTIFATLPIDYSVYIAAGTAAVVAIVALWNLGKFADQSGAAVADALGARRVSFGSHSASDRRFLNIVDEIAIAAGAPVPQAFVLDSDLSINAFAAGNAPENAIVCVTKGALNSLTRDELQGVIAHEFSHIVNYDMRLNMRTIALVAGVAFIGEIGYLILRTSGRKRSGNSKGGGQVVMIGLALYIIGLVGVLCGSLIKAAINRRREYLADASAVQFTRLSSGISGALKKIGGSSSAIDAPRAAEFSHFYFAEGAKRFFSFASHPPLELRIKAIEPNWDGNFITPKDISGELNAEFNAAAKPAASKSAEIATIASIGFAAKAPKTVSQNPPKTEAKPAETVFIALDRVGEINDAKIARARLAIAEIPPFLREKSFDPMTARWVIYAILIDRASPENAETQREAISHEVDWREFEAIDSAVENCDRALFIDLVSLCVASLKILTANQYAAFRSSVAALILADREVSQFEFNLNFLVIYPLDIHFGLKKPPAPSFSVRIGALLEPIATILSAIAKDGRGDCENAKKAFEEAKRSFANENAKAIEGAASDGFDYGERAWVWRLEYKSGATDYDALEAAYHWALRGGLKPKKSIVKLAILCVQADGKLSASEFETLRALCSAFGLGAL